MFNINYYKFLLQLIPVFLRTTVIVAFVDCLITPVKQLYGQFTTYRNNTLYELDHNGQVFSLQNVLNDRFDNTQRRIYITDGFTKERFYIHTRAENKPKFLKKYIHNRGDYVDTGVDFIVWIPVAIVISLEEMYELRALINKYRLDPKRYKVYRK